MCYSAMVEQDAKEMARRFHAKVATELYKDLFERRQKGEKLLIRKGMEKPFLTGPETSDEKAIAKSIMEWHEAEVAKIEKELFDQKKRLADAERTLKTKTTKKALNDQRVASAKIEKYKIDLASHQTTQVSESDSRIYPFHFVSTLALDKMGQKIIMPMRYHMRPRDKDESFDRDFNGCYNARFDNLNRVAWWKESLGKRHGIIAVSKFYENVDPIVYSKKNKLSKEDREKKNLVLCFEPENTEFMFIPVIWDVWKKKGQGMLVSGALITDEPQPEIAAAGHDRTPIFLKESAVDEWLHAKGDIKEIKKILMERERPFYSHKIVGVA